MPRIIARRFENIHWAERAIIDNLIDYDLYNNIECLANGGGKTVQIFLTNCLFTHRRKHKSTGAGFSFSLADYFQEGPVPGIVMVEVLLDQSQKRLLVGMLAHKVNGSFDQHNFLYAYKDPEDPMGIRHIPFIREKDGENHILSMSSALRLLEDHHIHVYDMTSNNDATRYYKDLMSYKISPSQWEDIVMKINEGEGGISKFFKGLDEPAIIRNWLFKVIEQKMNDQDVGEASIRDYLGDAFYRLCEKRRLVDQHLKTEKQSQAFIETLQSQREAFAAEKAASDEVNQKENQLESELGALSSALTKLHQQLQELEVKTQEKNQEITHIHCEKESQDYHDQVHDLDKHKEELALLKENLNQINDQLAADTYAFGLQGYAKAYQAYSKQEAIAQEYTKLLEDLGSNEQQRHLRDLGYSLKVKTTALIQEIEETLQKAKDQYLALQKENSQLEDKRTSIDEQIQKRTASTASLAYKIEAYKKQEENLLGEVYAFNMMGEHEEKFFENQKEASKKAIKALSLQIDQFTQKIEAHQNRLETIKSNQEQLKIEEGLTKGHLADAKAICDDDQKIMENREAHYPDFDPLDAEGIIASLDAHITKREEDIEEKRKDLEAKQIAYGQLSSSLNKTLSDFFTHHDIRFMSGMDYLRSQSDITDLITRNPLLSYAFVIDDRDFDTLKALDLPTVLEPAIFMKRSAIGQSHDVSLNDDTIIYVNRDAALLDEQQVALKRAALEQAIENIKEDIVLFKDEIKSAQGVKQRLLQEGLNHQVYEEHIHKVHDLEDLQKNIITQLNDLSKQADTFKLQLTDEEKTLTRVNTQKQEAEAFHKELLLLEKAYADYLNDYHQYLDDCQLLENAKQEKATLQQKSIALQETLQKVSNKQIRLEERLNQTDISPYVSYQEGTLIEASYEQLQISFEELKEALGSDEKYYHRMLDDAHKQMAELQKTLAEVFDQYRLNKEEALATRFEEARYKELENNVYLDEKQKRTLENRINILDGKVSVKTQNVETLKARILERYQMILPLEEIYDQFNERLERANTLLGKYKQEADDKHKQVSTMTLAAALLEKEGIHASEMALSKQSDALLEMNETDFKKHEDDLLADYHHQKKLFDIKHREVSKALNMMSDEHLDVFAKNMITQLRQSHEESTIEQALEKLQMFIEVMHKKLSINQNSTKEYHHDAMTLNDRICDYLSRIHQGLNEIDRHTAIDFGDRKRKLITIETASWEDNKALVAHKIENLLEEKLKESLTFDTDEALKQFKMKVIEPTYLYNETLGIDSIRLYALKIDQDHQRRFRWDSYRSGAEGTVSSMALLGALLSYLGTDPLTSAAKRPWSVLIMDNPFAEMVNNNLVRAFLEAAKSLHVQLILFTGSTQESIIKEADRVIISRLNPSGTIAIEEIHKKSTIEAIGLNQQMSLFDL